MLHSATYDACIADFTFIHEQSAIFTNIHLYLAAISYDYEEYKVLVHNLHILHTKFGEMS